MENAHNNPSPIQNPVTWTCERLTGFEMDPDVDYHTSYPINKNRPVYENIAIGDILLAFKQYAREDIRTMSANPKFVPIVTAVLNGRAFETKDICDSVEMVGYSLTQFRVETDAHELAVTALESGIIDVTFTHCVFRYELEGKITPPKHGWSSKDLEIIEPEFLPDDRVYVDKPSDATLAVFERMNSPYILKPVLKKMSCPPKFHELKLYGGKVMQYTRIGRSGVVFYKNSAKYQLMFENGFMTSDMSAGLFYNGPKYLTSGVVLNNNVSRFLSEISGVDVDEFILSVVLTRVVYEDDPKRTAYALVSNAQVPEDHLEENRAEVMEYLRYCVKNKHSVYRCYAERDRLPGDAGDGIRVRVLSQADLILPSRQPMWALTDDGARACTWDRLQRERPLGLMYEIISPEELNFIVKRM